MQSITLRPEPALRTKFYIGWLVLLVLAGGGMTVLGFIIGRENGGAAGAVLALWIVGIITLVWAVPSLLIIAPYYRSISYEIQDDEVIVRAGVITKSVKHVPYRTVTNIETTRGPLDRLFGIGTLKIQTAGASGSQSTAEETLAGLGDVEGLYETVASALRRFRGGMAPTQAEDEHALGAANGDAMAALLADVRAIRETLEQAN